MGNSQSFDKVQHVVKEGINIYEKVKKQQEQEQQKQQYQQQQSHNNNNNQHIGGGGGGSNHYHASPDVDDDDEYSQLRAQAHDEAQKRNDCYARSQEAYKSGNGAEGILQS
jgi:hypothetical protein